MRDLSKIAVLVSLIGLVLVVSTLGPGLDFGAVRDLLGGALPWLVLGFIVLRFCGGCSPCRSRRHGPRQEPAR